MSTADVRSDYIATRRVGDARVTIISDGTIEWSPKFQAPEDAIRRAIPEFGAKGTLTLGLNLAHVALEDVSLVIDPGCDDPETSWHERFAQKWPSWRRSPGLRVGLASIGVDPATVTHVLITHAHADHFGGLLEEQHGREVVRFPRARHWIGRRDWTENPARQDPTSELSVRLGAVERRNLLAVVEEEDEVARGVTMIPTPGETPGHCVVRIRSAGESFYYVGDLFHHPCEVEHPDWAPVNRDLAANRTSRLRVFAEAAASRATVVFSHARFPAWGTIFASADAFRWEDTW